MLNTFIRNYQSSDYQEIQTLWIETGLSRPERNDSLKTIEETIENGGCLILLIEKESKKIIGTSWISNDKRRLYLHHFAIKPEFQGKGLSKPLLKESLEFAKKMNMQIKLEVHKNNKKAIQLYQNYGFKYLGDYNVYIVREF